MGNKSSLPKSKSAEQISVNKKRKKGKHKNPDAYTSCPDIAAPGAVPYTRFVPEDSLGDVDYKLYRSYGDLRVTPGDSVANLKYYRRSTPSYATMPRNRKSTSAIPPVPNGSIGPDSSPLKRHVSEASATLPHMRRKASLAQQEVDSPLHTVKQNGPENVPGVPQVNFPSFRDVARRIRHFQDIYEASFNEKWWSLKEEILLSKIQVGKSLVKPNWVVSLQDYAEDADTAHMVDSVLLQGNAVLTLPRAFYLALKQLKSDRNVDSSVYVVLARDIVECVSKETGLELARIYEYQIAMLAEKAWIELFAKYAAAKAVNLLVKGDLWLERNDILRAVIYGENTVQSDGANLTFSVLIGGTEYKWPMRDILRKPALRKNTWILDEGIKITWHTAGRHASARIFGYRGVYYEYNYGAKCYHIGNRDEGQIQEEDYLVRNIHQRYRPYRRVVGTQALAQYLDTLPVNGNRRLPFKDFANGHKEALGVVPNTDLEPVYCLRLEEETDSVDISCTDWCNVDLTRAQIPHGNLSGASLRGAAVLCANLREADLQSTNINYSDMSYSDLSEARLSLNDLQSTKAKYTALGVPRNSPERTQSGVNGESARAPPSQLITNAKGELLDPVQVVDDLVRRAAEYRAKQFEQKQQQQSVKGSPASGSSRSEGSEQTGDHPAITRQNKPPRQTKRSPIQQDRKEKPAQLTQGVSNDNSIASSPASSRGNAGPSTVDSVDSVDVIHPRSVTPVNAVAKNQELKPADASPVYTKPAPTATKPTQVSPRRQPSQPTPSRSPARIISASESDLRINKTGEPELGRRIQLNADSPQRTPRPRTWRSVDPKRRSFPYMRVPVPLPETTISKMEGDLPPVPGTFTGRNTEVRQMCKLIGQGHRLLYLHGPHGVGKSTLAVATGQEVKVILGYPVFFVDVRGVPTVRNVMLKLYEQLDLYLDPINRSMFYAWMKTHKDSVVLILDNMDLFKGDPFELDLLVDELIEQIPNLAILCTRCEGSFSEKVECQAFELGPFVDDSTDLFQDFSPETSIDDAEELAEAVSNTPQSVILAAKLLHSGAVTFEELANKLGELNEGDPDVNAIVDRMPANDGEDQQKVLATTIKCVMTAISSLGQDEQRLLRKLSVFPASFNKVAANAFQPGPDGDSRSLARLLQLGLVEMCKDNQYFVPSIVKKTTQEVLRAREADHDHEMYVSVMLEQLEECISLYSSKKWKEGLRKYANIRDDIESILGHIPLTLAMFDPVPGLAFFDSAVFLYDVLTVDDYKRAYLNLLEISVSIDDEMFEMAVECCLAYSCVRREAYHDAEIHADRAYDILQRIMETATPSYKSFTLLMKGTVDAQQPGKLRDAIEMIRIAQEIEKSTVGLRRILSLHTHEQYALLNKKVGRLPMARHIYNIADYIIGETTGPHPNLMYGYKVRMEIWDSMMLFSRAAEVADTAAQVCQKAYGEHPLTAAALYQQTEYTIKQGNIVNSLETAMTALKMRKSLLGDHPETAISHKMVAYILMRGSRFKEAVEHAQKAHKMAESVGMDAKVQEDIETLVRQATFRLEQSNREYVSIQPTKPVSPARSDTRSVSTDV